MNVRVHPATPADSSGRSTNSAGWAPPSVGPDGEVGSDTAEEFLRRHPGVVRFARVGWAAKGVVYLLTGLLAFTIVANPFDSATSDQADPAGAVATIAQQPFGTALLWLLAIGLLIYAAWRITTVILPADVSGASTIRRIGYSVSAATYIVLALAAISFARQPGSQPETGQESGQDSKVTEMTKTVMEWPAGRWIVGLAGLVLIGVGIYFFTKGAKKSFEKEVEHRAVGPFSWPVIRMMGRLGWIGRSAMMILIGFFVTRAAVLFDPNEARGLDDDLRRVADEPLGMVLVVVVAVGLVLYGAYCIVTTPSRRLIASDEEAVAS